MEEDPPEVVLAVAVVEAGDVILLPSIRLILSIRLRVMCISFSSFKTEVQHLLL